MERFSTLSGHPLPKDKLDSLTDLGMIELSDTHLKATKDGRAVLNAVIRELLE